MKKLLITPLLSMGNTSFAKENPVFEAPVRIHAEGKPISIKSGYTSPTFIDLNNDGLRDLVIADMIAKQGPAEGTSDEDYARKI